MLWHAAGRRARRNLRMCVWWGEHRRPAPKSAARLHRRVPRLRERAALAATRRSCVVKADAAGAALLPALHPSAASILSSALSVACGSGLILKPTFPQNFAPKRHHWCF